MTLNIFKILNSKKLTWIFGLLAIANAGIWLGFGFVFLILLALILIILFVGAIL